MVREIDPSILRNEGKVIVGEFGFGSARTSGHIICRTEDREAVQAAYDAIEDGDMSPGALHKVYAAGGEYVVGL